MKIHILLGILALTTSIPTMKAMETDDNKEKAIAIVFGNPLSYTDWSVFSSKLRDKYQKVDTVDKECLETSIKQIIPEQDITEKYLDLGFWVCRSKDPSNQIKKLKKISGVATVLFYKKLDIQLLKNLRNEGATSFDSNSLDNPSANYSDIRSINLQEKFDSMHSLTQAQTIAIVFGNPLSYTDWSTFSSKLRDKYQKVDAVDKECLEASIKQIIPEKDITEKYLDLGFWICRSKNPAKQIKKLKKISGVTTVLPYKKLDIQLLKNLRDKGATSFDSNSLDNPSANYSDIRSTNLQEKFSLTQ